MINKYRAAVVASVAMDGVILEADKEGPLRKEQH